MRSKTTLWHPHREHQGGLPSRARIVEVGPRDGLQNEPVLLPTATKAQFVSLLAESGLRDIEVTSFVSPKRVPQLADAEALCAILPSNQNVRYIALVPNERGLDRAFGAGLRAIALLTAASETFSLRNVGMTAKDSLTTVKNLAKRARQEELWVRVYLSTAFFCPYEGRILPQRVVPIVEELAELDVQEVALADTIGHAAPTDVDRLLEVVAPVLPPHRTALHFHDTLGMGLANVLTALQRGYTSFDAAVGGVGGCPFAPGAAGNLATEDLVRFLLGMGIETGLSLEQLMNASRFLENSLGRTLPSRCLRALGTTS